MRNQELEQTLALIKPDALKNSLTGYVLSQLSEFHTGLIYAGTKVVHVTRMLAFITAHRLNGFEVLQPRKACTLQDPADGCRRDASRPCDVLAGKPLAAKRDDPGDHVIVGRPVQSGWSGRAIL